MDFVTLLSSIFALIGVAVLIASGRRLMRMRDFLARSVTAPGTVVGLTERHEGEEASHFPKVRFLSSSAGERIFESSMGCGRCVARIGEPVRVRYLSNQPDVAEIDAFMPLWGATLLFGGLGTVFLLIGLGILLGVIQV